MRKNKSARKFWKLISWRSKNENLIFCSKGFLRVLRRNKGVGCWAILRISTMNIPHINIFVKRFTKTFTFNYDWGVRDFQKSEFAHPFPSTDVNIFLSHQSPSILKWIIYEILISLSKDFYRVISPFIPITSRRKRSSYWSTTWVN